MSIVTKTGDQGQTSLMYNRRVSKCDPRVDAYGAVDELNAAIGLARASAELEGLSVTILWREKELAPGFVATAIRDLDGNLINIFQAH